MQHLYGKGENNDGEMLQALSSIKGIPKLLLFSEKLVIMEPVGTPVAVGDRYKSFRQIVEVLRKVHEVYICK
jgi:hypothetical protein